MWRRNLQLVALLAVVVAVAAGSPSRAAEEPNCFICAFNNARERLDCDDADLLSRLGRHTCSVECTTSGTFELCTCRTTGADCGFDDIPGDFLVAAPTAGATALESFEARAPLPLTAEVKRDASEHFGPLAQALLGFGLRPGGGEGLVTLRDNESGVVEVYEFTQQVLTDGGRGVFIFELPEHPRVRRLAGEVWSGGEAAFLTLEETSGETAAALVGQ